MWGGAFFRRQASSLVGDDPNARTAVCLTGQLRSAMCQPAGGGDSPLETIRRHLLPLLGKYDLFVLLDNSSALSNQPWVHEMIRDLHPREVDFQDAVKAEWEWLSRVEGVACMAKLGFYQARRLRKC